MNPQRRPGDTLWEREREEEEAKSNTIQWPLYEPIQNLEKHLTNKPTQVSLSLIVSFQSE